MFFYNRHTQHKTNFQAKYFKYLPLHQNIYGKPTRKLSR